MMIVSGFWGWDNIFQICLTDLYEDGHKIWGYLVSIDIILLVSEVKVKIKG